MPNGPVDRATRAACRRPTAIAGINNVYSQMTNPAASPPVTPARLAPGQYTAAMSAGANCATAASASVPMAARLGAFGARWKKP